MSDLNGARAKIERARKHIEDLSTAKAVFLDTNPYAATPEFYPEYKITAYYLDKFVGPPSTISLIAGDAIHNLRTALDFLAFALFRRNSPTEPGSHIYFPISKTAEKYESESKGKVKGLSQLDIDAIGALKPYGGGNDHLWALHQADIIDKHNLLLTPVVSVGRIGFNVDPALLNREFRGVIRFGSELFPRKTLWFNMPRHQGFLAFKQGDPVASVSGDRETYKDVELTFDIAFGEPEAFKGRPIIETLHELADLVRGIVDAFEL